MDTWMASAAFMAAFLVLAYALFVLSHEQLVVVTQPSFSNTLSMLTVGNWMFFILIGKGIRTV